MQKALITFLAAMMLLGCDHEERIAHLEKETKQLKDDIQKEQARERATAEYDLQAKCANDSKVWFNESWRPDKSTLLLNYTDHYNKSRNKCFILVEFHYEVISSSWTNDMSLWDIYENQQYGRFSQITTTYSKPTLKTEETVGTCEVYGTKCTNLNGFNSLTQPFLNN